MTSRQLIIVLVVLIALGMIVLFAATFLPRSPYTSPSPSPTVSGVCTMDAKICPDGSAVGRIPPSCEFALCPVSSTTTATFQASLGQRVGDRNFFITPLEVLEDSRCAADVQCIQAGTVRLRAAIASGGSTTTQTLVLGTPLKAASRTLLLVSVLPTKYSTVTVATSSYIFTIHVGR